MTTTTSIRPRSRRKIPTDRELMALPGDGFKRELLHGEIVTTPAGSEHGDIVAQFTVVFGAFVYERRPGRLLDGQTGFRMKSRDVLSPDISFVSQARLRSIGGTPKGFFEGTPDLTIEFLSPRESKRRLKEKLEQHFESGAKLVWIMDPASRTVAVHQGIKKTRLLAKNDVLTGELLVPGFEIPVSKIFAGID